MKKILSGLLAASLILALGACSKQTTPDPSQTNSTQPTQTQPTEPEPTQIPAITEPERPREPEVLSPVTFLNCTQWLTYPQFLSLGGGNVVTCMNGYDSSVGHFINTLEILDVYGDQLLATVRTEHTLELVEQRFADGHILAMDPASLTVYEYDSALKLLSSFAVPSLDGRFSYDRQSYYYIANGFLYRMNVSTGNRARMLLDQDVRLAAVTGIHPTEDLLVAKVYLDPYTDDTGLAAIDLTTGSLRLLTDRWTHLSFAGDSYYALRMGGDSFGYDIYTGTLTGSTLSRIDATDLGGDAKRYLVLPGSHLLLVWDPADDPPRSTQIYDLSKGGVMANLDDYSFPDSALGAVYLYDEDLILAFWENGAYFSPVVIDPKALTYSKGLILYDSQWEPLVDGDLVENYHAQVTLDDSLAQAQTQAEALEEKYGIQLLLADQAQPVLDCAGFQASLAVDGGQIQSALAVLDSELARYPEGFFKQFQNGAGEGGICIALTGAMDGQLETVGFARLLRETYAIGLDITAAGLASTVHHELWHAMEMVISTDTFDVLMWDAQNPAGFQYYGKYDSGYESLTAWVWPDSGVESWFVDAYSCINGREDRARIWEEAMKDSSEALASSHHLQQKLELMRHALADAFGETDW